MPKPTNEEIKEMGGLAKPFERLNKIRGSYLVPLTGEENSFKKDIYDATEDDFPPNVVKTSMQNIKRYQSYMSGSDLAIKRSHTYLWVIDSEGLFIIIEGTPNSEAERKCVCHTNITVGKPACRGGEMWFVDTGGIAINFNSGRYGFASSEEKQKVLAYLRQKVKYNIVEVF
jgi:hypothetical protein